MSCICQPFLVGESTANIRIEGIVGTIGLVVKLPAHVGGSVLVLNNVYAFLGGDPHILRVGDTRNVSLNIWGYGSIY